MNYKKESRPYCSITRADFAKLQAAIIAALSSPDIDGDGALEVLKTFGIEADLNFSPCFDGSVWEHPVLVAHNKHVGSKGILSAGFFTLYAKVQEYEASDLGGFHIEPHTDAYIQFILGRVGNTFSVGRTFHVIAEPAETPCPCMGCRSINIHTGRKVPCLAHPIEASR